MKKLDKSLSKIFFNSVEEMNECYGVDAELPSKLYSNANLVCYEIVNPFVHDYLGQYVFTVNGFHYLNSLGEPVDYSENKVHSEIEAHSNDLFEYEEGCFVYVRVNDYLRKHLEETLLGCEFVYCNNKAETPYRRFVHSVEVGKSGIVVTDQEGLSGYLKYELFYPDDHSDPIPYKEWIKEIDKQDVEAED